MANTDAQIIDWTVYALDRFAGECYRKGDLSEASLVDATIQLYEEGFVTVAWSGGQPVYTLTPEARMIMDIMKGTPEGDMITDIKTALEERKDEREQNSIWPEYIYVRGNLRIVSDSASTKAI